VYEDRHCFSAAVQASYQHWLEALPQHGPGRKHKRAIVLRPWQQIILERAPHAFLRGLIHSDGCRTVNRFRTKLPSGRVIRRAEDMSGDTVALMTTPEDYIAGLEEPRRGEIERLHELIRETVPELEPHVASGMLGYGRYHYRYASGREGDASLIALASQKRYISLYVLCVDDGAYLAERYVERLPKASIGKSCVRFKRTDDVDLDVLRDLVAGAARIGPAAAA
jgi:hypothetical protein